MLPGENLIVILVIRQIQTPAGQSILTSGLNKLTIEMSRKGKGKRLFLKKISEKKNDRQFFPIFPEVLAKFFERDFYLRFHRLAANPEIFGNFIIGKPPIPAEVENDPATFG